MTRYAVVGMLAALTSYSAFAADGDWTCKHGKAERKVAIKYAGEGKKMPCEVTYQKEGAEPVTKWSAKAQPGYCDDRAKEFLEKLKKLGFECS